MNQKDETMPNTAAPEAPGPIPAHQGTHAGTEVLVVTLGAIAAHQGTHAGTEVLVVKLGDAGRFVEWGG